MAHPYEARAELYRDAKNFTDTISLRLRPLGIEYRMPLSLLQRDARSLVDQKIDLVRTLTRQVRNAVGGELYRAAFDGEAPKDFDWDQLDRDELFEATRQNQQLNKRVETLNHKLTRYRAFMEANGKNWRPIEEGLL